MLDLWSIVANASWILGLSLLVSAYGYRRWLTRADSSYRAAKALPWFRLVWTSGILLAAFGWGLADVRWWERAFWFALALWFAKEWLGSAAEFVTGLRRDSGDAETNG